MINQETIDETFYIQDDNFKYEVPDDEPTVELISIENVDDNLYCREKSYMNYSTTRTGVEKYRQHAEKENLCRLSSLKKQFKELDINNICPTELLTDFVNIHSEEVYNTFGLYIAKHLRCLPRKIAVICQKLINEIITEAEIEMQWPIGSDVQNSIMCEKDLNAKQNVPQTTQEIETNKTTYSLQPITTNEYLQCLNRNEKDVDANKKYVNSYGEDVIKDSIMTDSSSTSTVTRSRDLKDTKKKKCPICQRYIKYLEKHLYVHSLTKKSKIHSVSSTIKKDLDEHPAKCPFPECSSIHGFRRLDMHLRRKHKLKLFDNLYKRYIKRGTKAKNISQFSNVACDDFNENVLKELPIQDMTNSYLKTHPANKEISSGISINSINNNYKKKPKGRPYFDDKERLSLKKAFNKYVKANIVPRMNVIRAVIQANKKQLEHDFTHNGKLNPVKIKGCIQNFVNINRKRTYNVFRGNYSKELSSQDMTNSNQKTYPADNENSPGVSINNHYTKKPKGRPYFNETERLALKNIFIEYVTSNTVPSKKEIKAVVDNNYAQLELDFTDKIKLDPLKIKNCIQSFVNSNRNRTNQFENNKYLIV